MATKEISKPWWESSTIWINLIAVVLLVIEFALKSSFPLDADTIALLTALANILNRLRPPEVVKKISLMG